MSLCPSGDSYLEAACLSNTAGLLSCFMKISGPKQVARALRNPRTILPFRASLFVFLAILSLNVMAQGALPVPNVNASSSANTSANTQGGKAFALPSIKDVLPASISGSGLSSQQAVLQFANGFGPAGALVPRNKGAASFFNSLAGTKAAKPFRIEVVAIVPYASSQKGQETQGERSKDERSAEGAPMDAQSLNLLLQKLALIANSVHKLEGLQYWSASRKTMRLLYEESWRIDSPQKQTRLSDPATLSELGSGPTWTFYMHQKDLTFGSNTSLATVGVTGDSMYMTIANANSLKLYFVPVVASGALETGIYVLPCKEGLVLYGVSLVQAIDVAANRVFESAKNRAFAVFNWFLKEAATENIVASVDLSALVKH